MKRFSYSIFRGATAERFKLTNVPRRVVALTDCRTCEELMLCTSHCKAAGACHVLVDDFRSTTADGGVTARKFCPILIHDLAHHNCLPRLEEWRVDELNGYDHQLD